MGKISNFSHQKNLWRKFFLWKFLAYGKDLNNIIVKHS
jgi:hypothetical protein|tara:strand:+ start:131 stop:244 length:114 start_codon:yes stop_codon:yes gene_type:complete